MREIKFRAYDKDLKRMINNVVAVGEKTIYFIDPLFPNETSQSNNPPRWELMQYTGLKDKNGKEIYEGDIVRFYVKDNYYEDTQVTWYNYPGHNGWWPNCLQDMEVIGNIYENLELLK